MCYFFIDLKKSYVLQYLKLRFLIDFLDTRIYVARILSYTVFWCSCSYSHKKTCISRPYSYCAFSSNLLHGQTTQKHINQMSSPENKKCSSWKAFGINHSQTPRLLSRRGPRSPDVRLSQHYIGPKMAICHFSNFCRQKFLG